MTELIYPKQYLYRRIVGAKIFIENHFNEEIDLDNISDEAYFSKFHFIRLFKNIYGLTPHQYLINVRINKSMEFIQSGRSVSESCFLVGFQSLSSFSGLFKKITGMAPSQFALKESAIKEKMADKPLDFVPGCFAEKKGWVKKAISEK